MSPSEMTKLNSYLTKLYGERFPGLTPGMAELWWEDLRTIPAEVVYQALKRWARERTHRPPTLDDLCAAIEDVQREQRRSAREQETLQAPTADEREDDFSSEQVRHLLASIWPDYGQVWTPKAATDVEGLRAQLREQARQILEET